MFKTEVEALGANCCVCVFASCLARKALVPRAGEYRPRCRCTSGWERSSTRRNCCEVFLKATKTRHSFVELVDCSVHRRRQSNTSVTIAQLFFLYSVICVSAELRSIAECRSDFQFLFCLVYVIYYAFHVLAHITLFLCGLILLCWV